MTRTRHYRQDICIIGCKLFLWWLLLHFVAHTIVTYGWGITDTSIMRLVRARKEILLIIAWLCTATIISYQSLSHQNVNNKAKNKKKKTTTNKNTHKKTTPNIATRSSFWQQYISPFVRRRILLAVTAIAIIVLTLVIHQQSLTELILAIKYDLFAYGIFVVGLLVSCCVAPKHTTSLHLRYMTILKILLIISLVRYISLIIHPQRLELLWYDLHIDNILWTADTPPQWVYKTQMRTWYIRNQWVFSGPWSRGFYLILMRPLFLSHLFGNTPKTSTSQRIQRWRACLFLLNVIVSFARAAQWVIILQTLAYTLFTHRSTLRQIRHHQRYTNKKTILTIITMLVIGTTALFSRQFPRLHNLVLSRYTSDSGHILFVQQWIQKVRLSPLIWYGATHAWPWSYHTRDKQHFNPENQFLQIGIEFGALIMIIRTLVFVGFGWMMYKRTNNISRLLSRWWLGIAWLVLHSFSDTMAVYPFMMLAWLYQNVNKGDHNT